MARSARSVAGMPGRRGPSGMPDDSIIWQAMITLAFLLGRLEGKMDEMERILDRIEDEWRVAEEVSNGNAA